MPILSIRSIVLVALAATFSTACAKGEPPAPIFTKTLPEQAATAANRLKPHTLRYEKLGNIMNYKVLEDEYRDMPSWLVEIDFDQDPESKPDQIWLDQTTLAFRGRLLKLKDYTIEVSMISGLFSGKLAPTEGSKYTPVIYNKQYKHDLFEPAIINYAIAALPLALGYTASIPVIDLNNGSQQFWSNIKVLSEEKVEIGGIEFDCWKVESNGIRKKTIWVSKKDSITVKMETKGNSGAWKVVPSSIMLDG
jgi:hypothetical protein